MERSLQSITEFYSQIISKGDLCFDVGANVGTKTKLFVDLGARVVCIEPQISCCKILQHSYKKIAVVNKGLAEKEGSINFYVCEEANTISTISKKWINFGRFAKEYKWGGAIRIPVTTLDKLIKIHGVPKFCKIDVEGSELRVLKGLTQLIPYLSFEFTCEFLPDAEQCMEHLLSLGPIKFNFTIGVADEFIMPSWVGKEEILNRIKTLIPKWNKLWGDIYVAKIN
jgi:FkbM family methyltransferase